MIPLSTYRSSKDSAVVLAPLLLSPELAIREFEAVCRDVVDAHVVALASGTAALHLALKVLGVGPGDKVITPTLTFVATSNAIAYVGAVPVFVDVDIHGVIALDQVEARLRHGDIKAVLAVDLFGNSAPMGALRDLVNRYPAALIEYAAEALGSECDLEPVGYWADISCVSFNLNKIITTMGGGLLSSHNRAWVDEARFLATQARIGDQYYHPVVGYNYRMSPVQAAVGMQTIETLPAAVQRRRDIALWYDQAFVRSERAIQLLPEPPWGYSNRWLSVSLLDPRDWPPVPDVIRSLAQHKIEARRVFMPNHLLPPFRGAEVVGPCPTAMRLYETGLCLPSSSWMERSEAGRSISGWP